MISFEYLVTPKGVFILINGEWRKSAVELRDLKSIDPTQSNYCDTTTRKLVATNSKTGKVLAFESVNTAAETGFSRHSINLCLAQNQNTHKGFEWKWAI